MQIVIFGIIIIVLKHLLVKELFESAMEKLMSLSAEEFPVEMKVRSVAALEPAVKSRVLSIISRKSSTTKIIFQEDPVLKDGIVIVYADTVLDFSLRDRLKKIWP